MVKSKFTNYHCLSPYVCLYNYLFVSGYSEGLAETAKFKQITALTQLADKYIVVDAGNHCLRNIVPKLQPNNQTAWSSSVLTGTCEQSGNRDGDFLQARFQRPWDVAQKDTFLYLTDRENRKIKRLDLTWNLVSTVHSSEYKLKYLAPGANPLEFYVTMDYALLHVYNQTENIVFGRIGCEIFNFREEFRGAGFYFPSQISWLDDKKLVVADQGVNAIKVIDLENQAVQAVCSGR